MFGGVPNTPMRHDVCGIIAAAVRLGAGLRVYGELWCSLMTMAS
jgi:hypothetical protein